jgi:hypothetical protein
MRFYYENTSGDEGYFSEKNLIKAIYTAWNIEANLYLLNDGIKKIDKYRCMSEQSKIVLCPFEENEFNSDILKEFGYYMTDGEEFREIRRIKDDMEEKYEWSEVKQLI